MIIHNPVTTGVALVAAMAGFSAGAFVLGVYDFLKTGRGVPAAEVPLMLALLVVPNVIAGLLFVKVWRSPEEWTLLGHRRRVWKVVLVVAYLMGIGCSGAMMM